MFEELFKLGGEEEKEEEVEEEKYDRIVETFSKALINIIVSKMKKLIEEKKIEREDVYDLWEAISEEIDIKIYDYLVKLAEE
jgi:tRNA A37 threonylcarbamoyltransferase TsaD